MIYGKSVVFSVEWIEKQWVVITISFKSIKHPSRIRT